MNGLRAFRAEQDVRKNTLPKAETDYQVRNTPSFKPPEGVSFEFDQNDPLLAQARKVAIARGLDQETFSSLLDLYASSKISEQVNAVKARETNLAALGAAGPQRVEAVATWLTARAGEDGKTVANFVKQYPSAPIVKAMETLIRQFSNQGGADFSQSHRETQAEEGKIPGYDNMSFAQKRVYQMQLQAQRQANQRPNGTGR